MLSCPDISGLPDDVAMALVRLTRLVNQMRHANPGLDRFALSVETEADLRAAVILCRHIEKRRHGFDLMLSPWDGRRLLETAGEADGGPVDRPRLF